MSAGAHVGLGRHLFCAVRQRQGGGGGGACPEGPEGGLVGALDDARLSYGGMRRDWCLLTVSNDAVCGSGVGPHVAMARRRRTAIMALADGIKKPAERRS